jgi:hypothetical protein
MTARPSGACGATFLIAKLEGLRDVEFGLALSDGAAQIVAVDLPEVNDLTVGAMGLAGAGIVAPVRPALHGLRILSLLDSLVGSSSMTNRHMWLAVRK